MPLPLTCSIYVPPLLQEAVRAEAARRGVPVARLVRDCIVATLKPEGYREIDRRRRVVE